MNKYKIIRINSDGDGIAGLYKNNKLVVYGDYYHDKIDDYIGGYMKCLEDNNIKYSLSEESYNDGKTINIFDCYLPTTLEEFYMELKNEC